ncbi:Hypothetical predicted protein, partial [Mytilus galloprovincialis]
LKIDVSLMFSPTSTSSKLILQLLVPHFSMIHGVIHICKACYTKNNNYSFNQLGFNQL